MPSFHLRFLEGDAECSETPRAAPGLAQTDLRKKEDKRGEDQRTLGLLASTRPPAGYEGTSLGSAEGELRRCCVGCWKVRGVESGPGRADRSDAPIFMLRVHDEAWELRRRLRFQMRSSLNLKVMAGMGPRQGRWLKPGPYASDKNSSSKS